MKSNVCRAIFSVALVALALGPRVAAAATPTCAAALDDGGVPISYPLPLSDADRDALSSSVYAALRGPQGKQGWPAAQISRAPDCEVAFFDADGASWTLSGGAGATPPRWAHAVGRDDYVFLAVGPADGVRPTYYLVGASGQELYVFRAYAGAPDQAILIQDMKSLIASQLRPVAIFDVVGGAVTLTLPTVSGIQAQLYGPPSQPASVFGPDGHFFGDADDEAFQMRGSGFRCRKSLGTQQRSRLIIVNQADETIDLGCGFNGGQSWITVFVTRVPDAVPLQGVFQSRVEDAIRVTGAAAAPADEALTMDFGRVWNDRQGLGQGLWLTRRGRYVIEARGTFTAAEKISIENAVQDIAKDVRAEIPDVIR